MAFVALPPELRSLCRRLTSTDVELLPSLLPALLKDTVRCQEPLSRAHDAKGGDKVSETTVLVNTLKTKILALLNGRSIQGHFVGAALVKAVIEAGGWECLRTCEPWVRALISILQVSCLTPSGVYLDAILTCRRKKTPMSSRIYAS